MQAVLGLLIRPRLINRRVYVFEGLRNRVYMRLFDPESVVVIGSHCEKKYAQKNGYGFMWGFPVESVVKVKIGMGWSWPGEKLLMLWGSAVKMSEKVVFFLYEDTQPLGIFFDAVAKNQPNKAVSVCIQHGYFMNYFYQIVHDGALSDVNLLWDLKQAELIGRGPSNCYEIGLPYQAKAIRTHVLSVVLVGTGMKDSVRATYEKCMRVYAVINRELTGRGIKVCYRPHPNEYKDELVMASLRVEFDVVEDPDKVTMLNRAQAIFVGGESSLLYEAGVAGHVVAFMQADDSIPQFDYDFNFGEDSVGMLVDWIEKIHHDGWTYYRDNSTSHGDPLARFESGLKQAGIL